MKLKSNQAKAGFMHIFFLGAVVILFMVFFTLSSEAMNQKLYRAELEAQLKLDYAAEAYYLLLREKEITAQEGISYGNLSISPLKDFYKGDSYIMVHKTKDSIIITSWFERVKRGEFRIWERKKDL